MTNEILYANSPDQEAETVPEDEAQFSLRFRDLLEAVPDAIVEVNRDGLIVLLNAAAENIFGYERQELLGQSVELLIPHAMRRQHLEHRTRYAAHPSMRPMGSGLELFSCRKDGSEFPVEISLSPIPGVAGGHVMAVVRDITARKQAEARLDALHLQHASELGAANLQLETRNRQMEHANRLKDEFMAGMSHELRTPLHTITGFADLLAEQSNGSLNQQQQRFVAHIQRDSRHLLDMINDILDLKKIEAGSFRLHRESFNASQAIIEMLSSLHPFALSKRIHVSDQVDRSLEIVADRERFKEILRNLTSNAIKFTPEDGRIKVESFVDQDGVYFCVSDTGLGISEAEWEAIFDKFYQVGATTRGLKEGTGLGLTIAKLLTEMHGGKIRIDSKPGEGSRFEIFFPYPGLTAVSDISAENTRKSSMLLVGTDVALFEQLLPVFDNDDYSVRSASTFEEVLEKSRCFHPQALIVDTVSLGISSEMMCHIRRHSHTNMIPIVALATREYEPTALSLGAAAVLTGNRDPVAVLTLVKQQVRNDERRVAQVLVVDDDLQARELLSEVLASAGYLPVPAYGGKQALQLLSRTPIAAAVVDLRMPEMSGIEVVLRIRERPRLATLPILVLTGKELEFEEEELLSRKANAVFLKSPGWERGVIAKISGLVPGLERQ
jgi:PAS domain S-box-containing protein